LFFQREKNYGTGGNTRKADERNGTIILRFRPASEGGCNPASHLNGSFHYFCVQRGWGCNPDSDFNGQARLSGFHWPQELNI
jgi:hypothetical protein